MKLVSRILILILFLYLLLLVPLPNPPVPQGAGETPFAWSQDSLWDAFEIEFAEARTYDCSLLAPQVDSLIRYTVYLLDSMSTLAQSPTDLFLRDLEMSLFQSAVLTAACPENLRAFELLVLRFRFDVKRLTESWNMRQSAAQESAYRLLYGARAALEEVWLQSDPDTISSTVAGLPAQSVTPAATILGVEIHSGDILVSRGGAPTSALIARGSDFPGNFSHIALAHVDSSGVTTIIESHIECGAKLATIDEYLTDTKLRVMVLRPRWDLPALVDDPMLPHKVATAALKEVRERHVPYDFAMDWEQSAEKFCSEVVYAPYRDAGVDLWAKRSRMSGRGVVNWLAAFGVEHFVTLSPPDLEYDPSVRMVAEWRDLQTLFKDHVDNAVIDAMLERADSGEVLTFDRWLLPFGRLLKAYSWVLNQFGGIGPVPEGMSAEAALRNERFSERHRMAAGQVMVFADRFLAVHGYRPPYWELVKLARQALEESS